MTLKVSTATGTLQVVVRLP